MANVTVLVSAGTKVTFVVPSLGLGDVGRWSVGGHNRQWNDFTGHPEGQRQI